jgi:hypothetical protein
VSVVHKRDLLILFTGAWITFGLSATARAHPMGSSDCGHMEFRDFDTAMCMPLPMAGMPMRMLMLHGNAFGVYSGSSGARGAHELAAPNMAMADLGTSLGDRHYLNLEFMGTLERWTFPERGYPELLQVGEQNERGAPYVDAQHPHSSPIMGLTLSDTIAFGSGQDHLRLFFAPRGQSTDGPVAFMHRPTGMVNPDAPLGHHIGQDVGHISSTVLGAAVRLGSTELQASAFHGEEPEPAQVDLPIGSPDSYAVRLIQAFSPSVFGMVSAAYVQNPEGHGDAHVPFVARYSASVYDQHPLGDGWMFHNAFICGLITKYDRAASLSSFAEEFWFHRGGPSIWGRIEVLQRTPEELAIASASRPDSARWVTAATLGYTHDLWQAGEARVGLGGSVTHDFLPSEFRGAYGGNPWTAKAFLQVSGMGMWDL